MNPVAMRGEKAMILRGHTELISDNERIAASYRPIEEGTTPRPLAMRVMFLLGGMAWAALVALPMWWWS
jgi:hypothetical protein